jgi:phosphoglycolate phosphatase
MEYTKKNIGASVHDLFRDMFEDRCEEAIKLYRKNYQLRNNKVHPMVGAENTLKFLVNSTNIYVAIVSNKIGTILREEVKRLAWEGYFKTIIGSLDAEHDKPNPAPLYKALEGSGLSAAKNIWLVGDSTVDIECALNAGCTSIWYNESKALDTVCDNYMKPDCTVSSHEELLAIIKKNM